MIEADLFRQILDNMPAGAFIKDRSLRYIYVNEAYAISTGHTREEMVGSTAARMVPQYAEAIVEEERRVMEHNLTIKLERDYTNNGQKQTYLLVKFPMRNDEGVPLGIVGISTEITGFKDAQAQLDQARRLESIGKLSSGVAHDFYHILGIIKNYLALMIQDELTWHSKQSRTFEEDVEIIRGAISQGEQLAKALLTFGHSQAPAPTIFNVNDVLIEAHPLLRSFERVHIEMRLADDLWLIKADRQHIEQIIFNLAINARDAMPEGGNLTICTKNEICRVESENCIDDGGDIGFYVCVVVSDTGMGMTPSVQARALEPFFTTKQNGDGSGSGLGLATVYGVVKAAHGKINIESVSGEGTTVKIQLPAGAIASQASA